MLQKWNPVYTLGLLVGQHLLEKFSHFGWHHEVWAFLRHLELIFCEILAIRDTLKRVTIINHPIKYDPQRIDIAFACILLLKNDLRSSRNHRAHMLFKQLPLSLYNLPRKPKIRNLQHPIINQNITRFNIPMHKIKLMQLLKRIQNLRKVIPHNNLTIH